MIIVPFTPERTEAVRRICIATSGEETEENSEKRRYILSMYCDCYLEHGLAFLLETDNRDTAGYILCAPDWRTHRENMEPYLAAIADLGGMYPLMAEGELTAYESMSADYPAHLHIDILEEYTGGGNGTALMTALLTHLREMNVPGIMLMVSAGNARAISFYKKMGFSVLREPPYALTMGQRL